jgi:hypothetical protein
VAQWAEHKAEASSVDWNLVAKHTFVSASWDSTIKVGVGCRQATVLNGAAASHHPNCQPLYLTSSTPLRPAMGSAPPRVTRHLHGPPGLRV